MENLRFDYLLDSSLRLDRFLLESCGEFSRSFIKKLIKDSCVRVNGKVVVRPGYRLRYGLRVEIEIPDLKEPFPVPVDLNLEVICDEKDFMIVNKPAGLVVHPGPGVGDAPTMVHGIMYVAKDLSGIGGSLRPGIVHRLDKGTSGVIMVCKNDMAHRFYSEKFKNREMNKTYLAFCYGIPETSEGKIESEIGRDPSNRVKMVSGGISARSAITHYRVKEYYEFFSLIEARPVTGRTHQIRVHMTERGNPILGDPVYENRDIINNIWQNARSKNSAFLKVRSLASRLMLHSLRLEFVDRDCRERSFEAPEPEQFSAVRDCLAKFAATSEMLPRIH